MTYLRHLRLHRSHSTSLSLAGGTYAHADWARALSAVETELHVSTKASAIARAASFTIHRAPERCHRRWLTPKSPSAGPNLQSLPLNQLEASKRSQAHT
jgi:hypothetical protein